MDIKLRNIPFSPPDMSEQEIAEVAATLRSGWITIFFLISYSTFIWMVSL